MTNELDSRRSERRRKDRSPRLLPRRSWDYEAVAARWPGDHLLSCRNISFVSCYAYSPHAPGPVCAASRVLCEKIKAMDAAWVAHCVGVVSRESLRCRELSELFGMRRAVLVPVPGSARTTNAPWPALILAQALKEVGLGARVWIGLRRVSLVRKSATAPARERPTVRQHYESFGVDPSSGVPCRLVLVDDVITKGRTLLAAAARLQSALPHSDIRAFALIRTVGLSRQLAHVLEVSEGVVRWAGGDARREP